MAISGPASMRIWKYGTAPAITAGSGIEQRKEPRRQQAQRERQQRTDDQDQQQAGVQRHGGLVQPAFALAAGGDGLHADRQAKDHGLAGEQHEAAQAHRRQRGIAKAADHGRVDHVQQALRDHGGDDGQRQGQDAFEAFRFDERPARADGAKIGARAAAAGSAVSESPAGAAASRGAVNPARRRAVRARRRRHPCPA